MIRPGESTYKAVLGSLASAIDDDQSFVGTSGTALAYRGPGDNVVGGSGANSVTAGVVGATVAGGGSSFNPNLVRDVWGTVGGGSRNSAGDAAGGTGDKPYATVAGGLNNGAGGLYSTVAGGNQNTAAGESSAVSGGLGNTATGSLSTVAGGFDNTASGAYSFAAGRSAKANNVGSFVWADSKTFDFVDQGPDSFFVRATGGTAFVTGIDANTGATTAGVYVLSGSGSWTSVSDRKAKRNFAPVDTSSILRRLAGVPITTWSYRAQKPSIRHIGPTAQDFARAFRVGDSPKGITTVDADGVALAAIQGLYRENRALKRENAALRRKDAAIDARLAALERARGE